MKKKEEIGKLPVSSKASNADAVAEKATQF